VINDLSTDQRVERSCSLLHEMGYEVLLVGRRLKDSPPLPERPYRMHRMRLVWTRGPLFYAEFNLRLFLFLLFRKARLIIANDLDTLLPAFLVARCRKAGLVYDAHEYFTGVPELEARPLVRSIWKIIERNIVPRLRNMVTVNTSIAGLYEEEYGVKPAVVRNIPRSQKPTPLKRSELPGIPVEARLIVLQGAGINIDRGAEEAVQAMTHLRNTCLMIIGGGDVVYQLQKLSAELGLMDKVFFFPRMPYDELMKHTAAADIGLTLDKASNINYRFSLPNKLFDYIHAGIPVLCSDLPEVAGIVRGYNIGKVLPSHDPAMIAEALRTMLEDESVMEIWRENLKIAARELCWEKEKEVLREIYGQA
jgi:glycosyltransferase involved in cell wall biosynthesis